MRYFSDELRKIELKNESEKLFNDREIKKFCKKVLKLKGKMEGQNLMLKEMEKQMLVQNRKLGACEDSQQILHTENQKLDKYLSLFLPIQIMNQLTELLHSTVDGQFFNKLVNYERQKYRELEENIAKAANQNAIGGMRGGQKPNVIYFDKEQYKIPIIPEPLPEIFVMQSGAIKFDNLGQSEAQLYKSKLQSLQSASQRSSHSNIANSQINIGKDDLNNSQKSTIVQNNSNNAQADQNSDNVSPITGGNQTNLSPTLNRPLLNTESKTDLNGSTSAKQLPYQNQTRQNSNYLATPESYQYQQQQQASRVSMFQVIGQTLTSQLAVKSNTLKTQLTQKSQLKRNSIKNTAQGDSSSKSRQSGQTPVAHISGHVNSHYGDNQRPASQPSKEHSLHVKQNDKEPEKSMHIQNKIKAQTEKQSSNSLVQEDALAQGNQELISRKHKVTTPNSQSQNQRETMNNKSYQTIEKSQLNENLKTSLIPEENSSNANDDENDEIKSSSISNESHESYKSLADIKGDKSSIKTADYHQNMGASPRPRIVSAKVGLGTGAGTAVCDHSNLVRQDEFESRLQQWKTDYVEVELDQLKDDIEQMIDEQMAQIAEQIDQKIDLMDNKFGLFTRALEMQGQQFEEALNQKQNELYMALHEFKRSIEGEVTRRARAKNDMILENAKMQQQMKGIEDNLKKINAQSQLVSESIIWIIEAQQIQNALDLSDEKDKEALALYGKEQNEGASSQILGKSLEGIKINSQVAPGVVISRKDKMQQQHQLPIQLDQNCISCSGNNQHTLKAFKIACLAYKSGNVSFKDYCLKRKTLMSIQAQIIHTLLGKLSTDELYSKIMQQSQFDEIYMSNPSVVTVGASQPIGHNYSFQANPRSHKASRSDNRNNINSGKSQSIDERSVNQMIEAMTTGVNNDDDLYLIQPTIQGGIRDRSAGGIIGVEKVNVLHDSSRNNSKDPYDFMSVKFTAGNKLKNNFATQSDFYNNAQTRMTQRSDDFPPLGSSFKENNQGKTIYGGFNEMAQKKKNEKIFETRSGSTGPQQHLQKIKINNHIQSFSTTGLDNSKANQSVDQIVVTGSNKSKTNLPNLGIIVKTPHKSITGGATHKQHIKQNTRTDENTVSKK